MFDRYHRLVLQYAIGRIGDVHLAEDVTQEVFVAAVAGIGRLRDESPPSIEGWLLGIARYKVADRRRQLARDRQHHLPEEASADEPGEAPDAADMALRNLSAAAVRLAMDRLSDAQREVVMRRFILDECLEDVATAMGKPVGAIKSLQHRALAALLRLCGEESW